MIRVPFDPDALDGELADWWQDWLRRAEDAAEMLRRRIDAGKEPTFQQRLWAELKQWMLDHLFEGRCAYCEASVTVVAYGDADHWRPKKEVTELQGDVLEPIADNGRKHPGYWWLAYEWSNLLPACERCNGPKGKGTQFPVAGQHVFGPEAGQTVDDLDREEGPLLLHPFRGPDPEEHLVFDEFGGIDSPTKSAYGKASISVFGLDRGVLVEKRLERLSSLRDEVKLIQIEALTKECTFIEAAGDRFERTDFAAAVRQQLPRFRGRNRDRL